MRRDGLPEVSGRVGFEKPSNRRAAAYFMSGHLDAGNGQL